MLRYLLILSFISQLSFSQSPEELDKLINKNLATLYDDPKANLNYAKQAHEMAAVLKSDKLSETTWRVSQAYFFLDKIDSANFYIDRAIGFNKKDGKEKLLANNYLFKARIEAFIGNSTAAYGLYEMAKNILLAKHDSTALMEVYHKMTILNIDIDRLDEGMKTANDAYRLALKMKDNLNAAHALNSMGIVHSKIGNLDKSIEVTKSALKIYKEEGESYDILSSVQNLGIVYKKKGLFKDAVAYYKEALEICLEQKDEFAEMIVLDNLGNVYNLLGKYGEAEKVLKRGLVLEERNEYINVEADLRINLANTYFKQGKIGLAEKEISSGIKLSKKAGSIDLEKDAHKIAKEIYVKNGNLDRAIKEMELFQVLSDSLFNLNKSKQINEIQTKYETEKKDAEISLLNKNAELDKLKKYGLALGLFLLAVIGLGLFYALYQKRKREQMIYQQKLEIAQDKVIIAEQSLDFKKKELASKALQLARKNEFLGTLEKEVERLKKEVDITVDKISRRIGRLIRRDVSGENLWEQFSTEFNSLHSGYMENLMEKHGVLSQSEIRLVSLLKMNLSSKDISEILSISTDGVKKARYRLRKKLDLNTEDDLEEYLLRFN